MEKTCIVLNYGNGEVKIIRFDDSQDIEGLLVENYDYSLQNIEYMVVDKLIINGVA